MRKRWFKAKSYGWGWTPAVWQGWAVLAAYALVIGIASWIMATAYPLGLLWLCGMLLAVLATVVLVIVSYLTGDPPGWHWGPRD